MYSLTNQRRLLSLTCQRKCAKTTYSSMRRHQSESHGISYVKPSGGTINLVNTVAQSNHITAGRFDGQAGWVLSKFRLVHP
jgi:hypothetical protein